MSLAQTSTTISTVSFASRIYIFNGMVHFIEAKIPDVLGHYRSTSNLIYVETWPFLCANKSFFYVAMYALLICECSIKVLFSVNIICCVYRPSNFAIRSIPLIKSIESLLIINTHCVGNGNVAYDFL